MTPEYFMAYVDKMLTRQRRRYPFNSEFMRVLVAGRVMKGTEPHFKRKSVNSAIDSGLRGGICMEQVTEALRLTKDDLTKSREELQKSLNEISKLSEQSMSLLAKQIKEIREARMVLTTETGKMLEELREVRKFFLEDAHDSEVSRLQQFIATCQELRTLSRDGTLEAVSDSIIKLSVKP